MEQWSSRRYAYDQVASSSCSGLGDGHGVIPKLAWVPRNDGSVRFRATELARSSGPSTLIRRCTIGKTYGL